ncbi:MAG: hypothetical protein HUU15_02500 [Candidatus Brocadiae bacterium]|nr:hypothetical protein [Candidatus Brocadiia bacterium]
MLTHRLSALALICTFAVAPALARAGEDPPDVEVEDDSYIPNRFSLTFHGAWARFGEQDAIDNTWTAGARLGFRVSPWAELQIGADYLKTGVEAEGAGGTGDVDIGSMRIVPVSLDLRIDITNIDGTIPWPVPWIRPELILGAGYANIRVKESGSSTIDVRYRGGSWLARAGLGLAIGPRDARVVFGVEAIYNWINNDLDIEDNLAGKYHGRIDLDYWTLGVFVGFRF